MATTEKLRSRYQLDLDELQNESERISSRVTVAEKKLQTFDKVRKSLFCLLFVYLDAFNRMKESCYPIVRGFG